MRADLQRNFQGKGIKIRWLQCAFRVLASQCVSACKASSGSESPAVRCRDAALIGKLWSQPWKSTADRSNTWGWNDMKWKEFLYYCHLFTPKRLNEGRPKMSLKKRGQLVSGLSCFLSCFLAHTPWLIELASAVTALIQLSECHKKKITSWFNGPGPLSEPSHQKQSTFQGIREHSPRHDNLLLDTHTG